MKQQFNTAKFHNVKRMANQLSDYVASRAILLKKEGTRELCNEENTKD